MEVENQTPSEDLSANPAPVDESASAALPDGSPDAAAPAEGEVPAWKPDFKFKVMDKEHEIDPLFQPIIKDEETLKKVRRMQEQALGIPHLEASRDEFKNKYNQVVPRLQEYDTVERKLGKLSHFVQNRDYGSFFDDLKIPRSEILQWVKSELEADALPQNVRDQMERARQVAAQSYDHEQDLNRYRQQEAMTAQQQVFTQVDGAIQQLAGDVATQFNERMASPEAFRHAVINKGAAIQQQTGVKAPLQEVIELVKQDLARVMGITGQAAQPAQAAQPGAPVVPAAKPPVIPNVRAGAASPVKTPPRSIADLKKLAQEME